MRDAITMLGVMGILVLTACTTTQEKPMDTQNFTQKIGQAEIYLLSEGQTVNTPDILIDASPDMFREYAPNGTYPGAVNAFLVRTPEHLVLVDAGYGQKLAENLENLNIHAEQVDIIALTHLHGDHIGGLLRDDKPVFPNAKVYLSQAEYAYWTSDAVLKKVPENRRSGFINARTVLDAYKAQLHILQVREIDEPAAEIFPGFYGIAAYGHTPGHTLYLLESAHEKLLLWGDITHASALQMPYPQVAVTYDVNPAQAVATRLKVMAYISRYHIPVAGAHIAFPGMGWVKPNGHYGYLFEPVDWAATIARAVRKQLDVYPKSRLQDIYKNFFQDYFGPEHLIADTASAAEYLRKELDAYTNVKGAWFEPVGWEGRFYRVNLSVVKKEKVSFQLFFEAFTESAGYAATPPLPVWMTQWHEIEAIIDTMALKLPDYEADKANLAHILQSGHYAVHHSEAYSNAYDPHYRIISKEIFDEKLRPYLK